MTIKPNYEKVKFSNDCCTLETQTRLECNAGIESAKIAKVFGVSKKVVLIGTEVIEGQIKYSGKAIFCLVYEDESGSILKRECGVDFSAKEEKDYVRSTMRAGVSLKIEKADVNLSGATASISAIVSASITFVDYSDISLLVGGENMYLKKQDAELSKGLGERSLEYPLEEDFEINCAVSDVLMHTTDVAVTAVQSGVGCIIVDGEAALKLMVLPKQENGDILKETKIIPFRVEVECEEAMPTMNALARLSEKSTKLNVLVDDEKNKSSVEVSILIDVKAESYENVNLELATDAYSSSCETEIRYEEREFSSPLFVRSYGNRVSVRGKLNSPLEAGVRLMCAGLEKVNLSSVNGSAGNIAVDGTIEARGFLKDIEGKISVTDFEAPFTLSIEGAYNEGDDFDLSMALENLSARFVSTEEIELDASIRTSVTAKKRGKIKVITEIKEGEEKRENTSAISVYIPLPGEDLWTVSKRLNACPEAIEELNKDLTFPLTGEERIVIYRQLKRDF